VILGGPPGARRYVSIPSTEHPLDRRVHHDSRGKLAIAIVMAVLWGITLRKGIDTTGDLNWPGHMDLYRDISQSEMFLQGKWLADPFYREQTLWYSPLVPAIVAAISRLSDLGVNVVYTRSGAYLNLIGAIAFFVMMSRFYGLRAAVASSLVFLLINGRSLPFYATATYSPWLLASHFTQALFYLGLVLFTFTRSRSYPWHLLFGGMVGLTFLGHPVPGLLLASVAVVSAVTTAAGGSEDGTSRVIARLGVTGIGAVVVASPFLYSIVGIYGLHVANPAPGSWLFSPSFRDLLSMFVGFSTPVALGGVVWAFWHRKDHPEGRILFAVGAVCLLFVALRYVPVGRATRAASVPTHHFVFYLKALEASFFGIGLAAAAGQLSRLSGYQLGRRGRVVGSLFFWTIAGLLAAWSYPVYSQREDFTRKRSNALAWQWRVDRLAAIDWIERSTEPSAIFLCDDRTALFAVGPAGRYVLVTDPTFSNPYVSWKVRDARRRRLFTFLERGNGERAREYAGRHDITFIMLDEDRLDPENPLNRKTLSRLPSLRRAFQRGRVTIYRFVGGQELQGGS
jgi:hypothetical protein